MTSNANKILVINPGSTSTKIAVFDEVKCLMEETIRHFLDELVHYPTIISQYEFRKDLIVGTLELEGINLSEFKIVMGRGGLTYPLESGIYLVDHRMLTHVRKGVLGQHASNLGPILAHSIAKDIGHAKAYIADPVVTDELEPVARVAGHPRFERQSIYHALNQKAVARIYAHSMGKSYSELNLIVAHMGGGVSIGAHLNGKVVDVNNALDGEGPFSPERSGTLPVGQLIEACYCGNFTKQEIKAMVNGEGGMVAYLKTNSMIDIDALAKNGNVEAIAMRHAFAYQVSKSIGEMATVLQGKIDGIILTGGVAHDKGIVELISNRVAFLGNIKVYPGEDEMAAMAMNAQMLMRGKLVAKIYPH